MKQKQDLLYILKTHDLKEGLIIIKDPENSAQYLTMRITYDEDGTNYFICDYKYFDLTETRVC